MLEVVTNNLLQYCKRTGDWEPEYNAQPVISFFNKAYKLPDIKSKWDTEIAYEILLVLLDNYRENLNAGIDTTLCNKFVQDFINKLDRNKAKHFIVLPLTRATCNSIIKFDRYLIIPEHLSREEKIKLLSRKVNRSLGSMNELADHTERSRSPNFYNCTLFCVRVSHQTSYVEQKARAISMWNVAFLRAIYYGYGIEYPYNSANPFQNINQLYNNNHLLILSRQSWRISHEPLHFNASCSFPLDWLKRKRFQNMFVNLNKLLVFKDILDNFSYRFYRSFRFFSKSIDFVENREPFEGLGLSILFLMIAAEGILLEREENKKSRLACLLPKLTRSKDITPSHAFKIVNDCYRQRSDFVHSGADVYPKYDKDFKEGKPQKDTELLRKMVARLLLTYPKHYKRISGKLPTPLVSDKAIEKEWFKYINACWERSLIS